MQEENIKIIGGVSGYIEIDINDDFKILSTKEDKKTIRENLEIIKELEGKK